MISVFHIAIIGLLEIILHFQVEYGCYHCKDDDGDKEEAAKAQRPPEAILHKEERAQKFSTLINHKVLAILSS